MMGATYPKKERPKMCPLVYCSSYRQLLAANHPFCRVTPKNQRTAALQHPSQIGLVVHATTDRVPDKPFFLLIYSRFAACTTACSTVHTVQTRTPHRSYHSLCCTFLPRASDSFVQHTIVRINIGKYAKRNGFRRVQVCHFMCQSVNHNISIAYYFEQTAQPKIAITT